MHNLDRINNFNNSDAPGWVLGDFKLSLRSRISTKYDDNIFLTKRSKKHDWIIAPGLQLELQWSPSADKNLSLSTTLSYQKYLRNLRSDYIDISPDSTLEYNFYMNEYYFSLTDQFSFSNDPTSEPGLVNTPEFTRFNNVGRFAVYHPYAFGSYNLAYINNVLFSNDTQYQYLNRMSHSINAQNMYNLLKYLQMGPVLSASTTIYSEPIFNNYDNYSIGITSMAQLTKNTILSGQVGYNFIQYQHTGSFPPGPNFSTLYFNASLQQQINSRISHFLQVNRQTQPSINTELREVWDYGYSLSMVLNSKWQLQIGTTYSVLSEQNTNLHNSEFEVLNIRGSLGYRHNQRINSRIDFVHIIRDSLNQSNQYDKNIVELSVSYLF